MKMHSIENRRSKFDKSTSAHPHIAGTTFKDFLSYLPNQLAVKDLKSIARRVARARQNGKLVMLAMGAHVIKVGLSPIIRNLISNNIITSVSMNGACIVHDTEIAMVGNTSEMVDDAIKDGSFGMSFETADFVNSAILKGSQSNVGLGYSIGREIKEQNLPNKNESILYSAYNYVIPSTVHVAIGTDIIHMHPSANGEAIGKTSMRDFRTFCDLVADLEGGVFINIGSAVIIPEVFLKAISLVRNRGHIVNDIMTVNMDFIQQYRPMTNIVKRPTSNGGIGINLIGHHEIMVPLLAAAIMEEIE